MKNINKVKLELFKLVNNKKWTIILIFTLLPFVINSFYNLPIGDDFNFGNTGRNETVLNAVKYWYNNWGGRYTQELFLTIFNPLSFNSLNYFWLPPLVLILCISISILFLIKTIANTKLTNKEIFILLTVILFLVFDLMPEIGEVLYWISGAYTFQIGNIFTILLVSIWFKLHKQNSIFKSLYLFLIASILIVLISGTNEISMAYTFGFLFLYMIYCLNYFQSKIILSVFLFLISCVSVYFSIMSPGNFIRASHTGGMLQELTKSFIESIIRGIFYIVFWLPSTVVLTFFVWKPIGEISKSYNFYNPNSDKLFFKIVFLFCAIIFAGFFPSLASTGWNPSRTVAPIFIVFILSFFGICIYFYEYINAKFVKFNFLNFTIPTFVLVLFILGFSNQHNVMNAYTDIVSLKSYKYNIEIRSVYEQLSSKNKDTIAVLPLKSKPKTLPIRWPDHYNNLVNNELKLYFNKEVIMKTN